ncbi:MAG: adenosylcobinamide-GDP ribazoletransferase [Acidimicrobiales bacterium]
MAFLTVFGRGAVPTPASLSWFPVVGAAIGTTLGVAWWGLEQVFPAAIAAVVVVAADLAITGMLHFDGLCDSADGLLPHLSTERRLEVMREPQVGAFGILAAVVVLVARVVALGTIAPISWWKAALLLGAIWAVSRSVMVMATARLRYVRSGGIAAVFLSDDAKIGPAASCALGAVAVAGAALVAWWPVAGIPVLTAALAGSGAVFLLAERRLGGYTGDVLGAAGVVGETLALLVAAARW